MRTGETAEGVGGHNVAPPLDVSPEVTGAIQDARSRTCRATFLSSRHPPPPKEGVVTRTTQ